MIMLKKLMIAGLVLFASSIASAGTITVYEWVEDWGVYSIAETMDTGPNGPTFSVYVGGPTPGQF